MRRHSLECDGSNLRITGGIPRVRPRSRAQETHRRYFGYGTNVLFLKFSINSFLLKEKMDDFLTTTDISYIYFFKSNKFRVSGASQRERRRAIPSCVWRNLPSPRVSHRALPSLSALSLLRFCALLPTRAYEE